ncbi:MAG: LLM class F420-dependent oxidoreductase [Actinomycetota bacterium]|nr:LLM class F420-dependent oxidoreductase [Actinomycetota bacterium]
MRFSVWPNPGHPWPELLDIARHAEATGWDGLWMADHFMPNDVDVSGPVSECWTTLAAVAATVPRIRLGALVTGNTYRHPAVLAKTAATVDQVSGGRVVLGLGAGWQENEHRAYGIDFATTAVRLARLEEACRVVKALFSERRADFDGEHYTLVDAPLEPKPVQDPLPLLVGGGGEKVTLRIAATYADEWNVWGDPATLRHKSAVLDRHCADVGRDPATILRSAQALLFMSDDDAWLGRMRGADLGRAAIIGTPAEVAEVVGEYAEAGVDELIVPDFNLGRPERRRAAYDTFIAEVAPAFR